MSNGLMTPFAIASSISISTEDREGKQARGRDGDNLEHMTSFRRVMTRPA